MELHCAYAGFQQGVPVAPAEIGAVSSSLGAREVVVGIINREDLEEWRLPVAWKRAAKSTMTV
jgi:hypothetical protein